MKKSLIFVIIAVIIILGIIGYFYFSGQGEEEPVEVEYKGVWMSTLLFRDPNYLDSNAQKLKDMGINTIYLSAFPPYSEASFERLKETFAPEIVEMFRELIPIGKELIIDNIEIAHRNDLKVALTVITPSILEEEDVEELNSQIIEYARLAEEYDVELFAPMAEPPNTINTGSWRQEILLRIKEVYHGEIFWSGAGPGLPNEEQISQISEQPPGDFAGYDYIGFSILFFPSEILNPEERLQFDYMLTLEDYSQYVEEALDYKLAIAERDGVKGVIITEFGVIGTIAMTESNVLSLSEEEMARAFEIVLEKGEGQAVGLFANSDFLGIELQGIPVVKENLKTQEIIKRYFTEIL